MSEEIVTHERDKRFITAILTQSLGYAMHKKILGHLELIQQLQALGFVPSAYSCESATLSHWPHRDLRVSADAVAVGNDLHSCSRPQAILKVRHLRSLDYRPCQRSCLSIYISIWQKL